MLLYILKTMSSPNDTKNTEPNAIDKIADTVKTKAEEAQEKMGNQKPEPDHLGDAKDKLFEAKDAAVDAATHVKDAAVDAVKGDNNNKPQENK